jgi:hypothetical protein
MEFTSAFVQAIFEYAATIIRTIPSGRGVVHRETLPLEREPASQPCTSSPSACLYQQQHFPGKSAWVTEVSHFLQTVFGNTN